MRNIIGIMLVDAPHSALNNSGMTAGDRTENIVRTKTIQKGRHTYPYVSGQAVRHWWRETLLEKFDWKMSPLIREEKIVFSEANPLIYEDDDIFGYMRAPKGRGSETVTRTSPLKVSPLVSVIPQIPVQDFGVSSRHEGDPVPYEHEFYSTILKGIFSLNIDSVGVFTSKNRAGHKNITKELSEQLKNSEAKERESGTWVLPTNIRIKRTVETIKALPYIFGGAMQSRHLTDVTPKFLIMSIIDGGNHIFMNVINEKDGEMVIDFDGLLEIAQDYKDLFLSPIYIAKRKGFLNEIDDKINDKILSSKKGKDTEETVFEYGSINQIVEILAKKIEKLMQ